MFIPVVNMDNQPLMPTRPMIGVALIVRKEHQVLLHKRNNAHGYGTWAFVGGHMEMWEDLEQTALRELAEEAGPDIKIDNLHFWTIANTKFFNEGKHYVCLFMVADWVSGEPKVMEPEKCKCWEWFAWDSRLPSPLMLGVQNLVDRKLNPMAA